MAAINRTLLVAGAVLLIVAAAAYIYSRPTNNTPDTTPQGGSGSSTSSTTTTSTTTTPKTNSSIKEKGLVLYTFETPIKIFIREHPFADGTLYYVQGYISWVPETPYVRYYEVTVNFNGNNLHAEDRYSSNDFQLWGNAANPLHPYLRKEGEIVALGPPELLDLYKYWGGNFKAFRWSYTADGKEVVGPYVWPETEHGWRCFGISAYFNSTITKPVTHGEMESIKADMREFMEEYTRGWTYTVRAMNAGS